MSQVLNILKNGKCKLRNQENTTGERGKLSHRKHLQKGSVKRQIAAILVKIRRNGERPPNTSLHPKLGEGIFYQFCFAKECILFIITHNKISRFSLKISAFPLKKKKICALARKDICTVNKQIKFSLEWIYNFFLILCSPESAGPKHMSDKAAARLPETATSNCSRLSWLSSFPLDLPPLHSVFWEHHCTGCHKLHRDTMQVHLLSRNHLCPWLPDRTSSSKGWECNTGGRWKVWAVCSWEWGEESKQAQRPVAPTYLQHTDGQICPKNNSTREEDPDSCSGMHREKWPLSS